MSYHTTLSERVPGWYRVADDLDNTVADCIVSDREAAQLAAAPDMLEALRLLHAALSQYRLLDVRKRFSLSIAHAAAGAAIARAEGSL